MSDLLAHFTWRLMLYNVATFTFCPEWKAKSQRCDLWTRGCFRVINEPYMLRTHKHTRSHAHVYRQLHKHHRSNSWQVALTLTWPAPIFGSLSLSLSPHTPTPFLLIFRFLPCVSVFPVSPQFGRRLHCCGLIGSAWWVGCFVFFFPVFASEAWEMRGRSVGRRTLGQLVGAKKPRCKDQRCHSPPHAFFGGGASLMISSSEGWRMMSL